ncbi:MAG: hypothetical protein ACWGN1_02085 [Desulfobulbales bacterium]
MTYSEPHGQSDIANAYVMNRPTDSVLVRESRRVIDHNLIITRDNTLTTASPAFMKFHALPFPAIWTLKLSRNDQLYLTARQCLLWL